jgi:hypothetical protein
MMKAIVPLAIVLMGSASLADEVTFESLQQAFRKQVLSLVSQTNASAMELQSELAAFAQQTFGVHPGIMRKEAEKRFADLPVFPARKLESYDEHMMWDQFPLPSTETGLMWLMFGWDPERLADTGKKHLLARHLSTAELGRLAILNAYCPDRTYRMDKSKYPDLVVESLGDLFIVHVEMTNAGACKPVWVKWLKKKESRTTESTLTE